MIETAPRLDDLLDDWHERCAWCNAPFVFTDHKLRRYKALDGQYYCSPEHASAMYMEGFDEKLRAMR